MNDSLGPSQNDAGDVGPQQVDALYKRLHAEAEASGYHLNPDVEFTRDLVRGLLVNEKRYGYWACPCRLADGDSDADRDIVCPCDYRDADLDEYGMCYCALYVSDRVVAGELQPGPIPERRPEAAGTGEPASAAPRAAPGDASHAAPHVESGARPDTGALSHPVWRCRVCGYLCARDKPPLVCPVCKAKQDRFERFM